MARSDPSVWMSAGLRPTTDAKQLIEGWRLEYNEVRPHRTLGERTPYEFARQLETNFEVVTEKGTDHMIG